MRKLAVSVSVSASHGVLPDRADDDGPLEDPANSDGVVVDGTNNAPAQDRAGKPVGDAVVGEPAGDEVMLEPAVEDIRGTAAREPKQRDEDVVRVPAAEETAADVEHARRALFEIRARQAEEEREAAEQREQQLAHWHADDTAVDDNAAAATADAGPDVDEYTDDGPVLEYQPAQAGA